MATEWKQARLGDICEVVRGGSPRPIIDYITDDEDGVNWLKIGDVKETDKYFTHANERIKRSGIPKTREVKKGDLILSNSMSFGRAFITLIDGYIHDGWLRLRCDERIISKEYLYYFLISSIAQNQFKAVATGSVVSNLKSDTVKDTVIDVPPLSVQKQIVAILDALDQKIVNNQKINDNLQQQIIAVLFSTLDANRSPSVKLGEYLYIKGRIGWKGLKKSEYLEHSDYRIINGESLTLSGIDWNKAGFITKERYDESPEIMLQVGDILLSKDGTIGKIGYVDRLDLPTSVASGIFVIRNIQPDIVSTQFIYYLLKSRLFTAFIASRTEGSVIPHLYQKDFLEFEFPLPDKETMQWFDDVTGPMFKQIFANLHENEVLIRLRDTLLPKLMSGEIDVSTINI